MSESIETRLAALTTEEKADLVAGEAIWTTKSFPAAGIPAIGVTDGPNGARGGGLLGTGTATACIPAGAVLGATWDPELVERLGGLLGDEARAKGCRVLLAPTINLHRNPLGGRNFECYSEDPILSGLVAAAFVRGVQSRGVATTPKHFAANDSEFERNTIDSQVDERTLRELYLVPFEYAVIEGGTWGLMSAYNRLNGTFCSENEWLLNQVLRQEWGFDGFVVSDWFAARSTAASARAGLSLEMPGPGQWYNRGPISEALAAGEMDEGHLDRIAGDVLRLLERTGAFDGPDGCEPGREDELDRPEDRALVRQAAAAGTVLVANNGVLPLDPSMSGTLAVIGPNARKAQIMGGGSATVQAYRNVSLMDALGEEYGHLDISYSQGCDIERSLIALSAPMLKGKLRLEYFNGHDWSGPVVHTRESASAEMVFFGEPGPGVNPEAFSVRASGVLVAEDTGEYSLGLVQLGRCRVLLDGQVVLDATEGEYAKGDDFFGMGSEVITSPVQLTAGREAPIVIEYSSRDSFMLCGARVGLKSQVDRDLIGEAVEAATAADVAVVVVGTNSDWETEGRDRDSFDLPGDQPELIKQVAAANPNTVVVVNTGGACNLDWADEVAGVLVAGFGGQEMGNAVADVLFGQADPGGRMTMTVPARYEHNPAYLNYPGENGVVRYGEGLHIGHRWFDARAIEPAVPFGHGLSYAAFEWSAPRVTGGGDAEMADPVIVEVDVVNTSDRSGSDVVQVYVEPPPSLLHRPVRELKGFAKVHLAPGERTTARIVLTRRAFAYYDPGDQSPQGLAIGSPVPAGESEKRTDPGWYVDPGTYTIWIARSSANLVHAAEVQLNELTI
ncbi:MAG: glycoside hydrolase family 3 protein [Acidimicrobiia bacterium]|nr:glycoside hydrolase family 3 protein [Acidimicrobiia bacterium]MYG73107.1 glycoside hydrolase family 3 protein [Acidimicrobiia bacterium]